MIMNNRGRTQALSESLAALFEVEPKSIEIGSTLVHKRGTTTHVVQMVYQSALDILKQELNDDSITVSPYFYVQQLFASLEKDIAVVFRCHFK